MVHIEKRTESNKITKLDPLLVWVSEKVNPEKRIWVQEV